MIASAILALAVLATTFAVAAGQGETYSSLNYLRATALAETMMEEIVAHPYLPLDASNALGPEAGETRATFTSVDDFHGLSESAGALKNANGVLYPDAYQGFSRSVSVSVGVTNVPGATSPVSCALAIVTVSDSRGVCCQIQRIIR